MRRPLQVGFTCGQNNQVLPLGAAVRHQLIHVDGEGLGNLLNPAAQLKGVIELRRKGRDAIDLRIVDHDPSLAR